MSAPRAFRCVAGVAGGWTALRAAALLLPLGWTFGPHLLPGEGHLPFEGTAAADRLDPPRFAAFAPEEHGAARPILIATGPAERQPLEPGIRFGATASGAAAVLASYRRDRLPVRGFSPAFLPETAPAAPPLPNAQVMSSSRWSGSAWAYLRDGSGRDIATAGQLGGSQAGVRLAWKPWSGAGVALFGRATSPLGGEAGAELAAGIDWQPVAALPVRLSIERRVALDLAGRDAFALVAAGGVYAKPLPGGFRLDAYAQTGVVGARRRDLFVDGGARVGVPLPVGRAGGTLTLGGGIWGAAQPGVARLDIGPQAALRLPAGRTGITVAADWRVRVAGDARPGSGPALTVAADF